MWHWQGFHMAAQFLLTQGVQVVLVGAKSDETVCTKVSQGLDVINLAGQTTIPEAMFVIKHARLVVCNDSMSLHMASAMKIPTVAIFCATSPEFGYGPWKNRAIIIERKNLACKPCRPHGSRKCPNGSEACMNAIDTDEVIKAIKELLAIP
jgi:heptosyltransferase-2